MDDKTKRNKAREEKIAVLAEVKAMKTDSDWNVLEEILMDVLSVYVIKNPDSDKGPPIRQVRDDMIAEIKVRYKEEKDVRDLLIKAMPSEVTLGKWAKNPKIQEAVWSKIKDTGLFTKERRAEMINALYNRGINKSDNAAKIWLTLSGDYSDKIDINQDKAVEKFREINEILHKKN